MNYKRNMNKTQVVNYESMDKLYETIQYLKKQIEELKE